MVMCYYIKESISKLKVCSQFLKQVSEKDYLNAKRGENCGQQDFQNNKKLVLNLVVRYLKASPLYYKNVKQTF
jgi:hypothetical protein